MGLLSRGCDEQGHTGGASSFHRLWLIVRAHARCRLPVSRASLKDAFVAGENDFGYNDNMVAVFPSG